MRTFPVNPTLKWRPLQSLQMLCKGWQKLCSHVFFYWRIYECWSLSLQKLFEDDRHPGLVVYFVSEKTHKFGLQRIFRNDPLSVSQRTFIDIFAFRLCSLPVQGGVADEYVFLRKQMEQNLHQLSDCLGKSVEDSALLLHQVFKYIRQNEVVFLTMMSRYFF